MMQLWNAADVEVVERFVALGDITAMLEVLSLGS